MKTQFLLLIVLCIFPLLSKAQSVFPILSDAPAWTTVENTLFSPPVTTNRWTMLNDSSVCGDDYQYAQPDIFYNFFFIRSKEIFTRIDSQKVYYRINSNCNLPERVLYDYSLSVGDTFYLGTDLSNTGINFDTMIFVVDSINTENLMGINRRVLTLSQGGGFPVLEWIEGIGNKEHPFYPLFYHGTEEEFYTLCYDSSGVQLYVGDRYQSCTVMVAVSDPLPSQIDLYPNPSAHGWQLKSEEEAFQSVQVVDLSGKLVYQALVNDFKASIPSLPAKGIYLLEVQYESGSIRKKLVQE